MRRGLVVLLAAVISLVLFGGSASAVTTLEAARRAKADADVTLAAAQKADASAAEAVKVAEAGEPPPKEEPPPSGAIAAAAPTGPEAPVGGWHIAFADAFGQPLGSSGDTFWHGEQRTGGCCGNGNEYSVEVASHTRVGSEGLELVCTEPGHECAGANTNHAYSADASTPHPFRWTPGAGVSWVIECFCRWPVNTAEADPGFWTDNAQELDFFEGFGWGHNEYWAGIPVIVGQWHNEYYSEAAIGFHPSAAFHHYTTELVPSGSSYEVREYLDGVLRATRVVSLTVAAQEIRMTYALRHNSGQLASGFTSGSRVFGARSIEVWQDAAHAGVNVSGGGVAPGTSIG